MKIQGKEFELTTEKNYSEHGCDLCHFAGREDECKLDLSKIPEEDSCLGVGNNEMIYKLK